MQFFDTRSRRRPNCRVGHELEQFSVSSGGSGVRTGSRVDFCMLHSRVSSLAAVLHVLVLAVRGYLRTAGCRSCGRERFCRLVEIRSTSIVAEAEKELSRKEGEGKSLYLYVGLRSGRRREKREFSGANGPLSLRKPHGEYNAKPRFKLRMQTDCATGSAFTAPFKLFAS